METVEPGHAQYDELRSLFNLAIDRRPAVIARCATPADVAEALALARSRGLRVAVRAGGHSVAGASTNDGGLVIDVRPMKELRVDAGARFARVGAGVTWGEFDFAAQAYGLAATGGRATSTGVAGFTLGGGDGWLSRSCGLACDSLLAVELVTADGEHLRASPTEHPELFWALHGGGGNFGVATAFEFRLHPVGPEVLAGIAMWPGERAGEVVRAFRDVMPGAPEGLGAGILMIDATPDGIAPPELIGRTAVILAACWTGPAEAGREALRPFRDLEPVADVIRPMSYVDFQVMLTDPPGFRHYWSADYHDEFPDEAVDVFVASGHDRATPLTQQVLFAWGGAVARVPEGETPIAHRRTKFVTHPFAVWEDPADDGAAIAWARRFRRDIAAHTNGGVYLNFIGNEGPDRVRAAFGEANYDRLAKIKVRYDPQNVFRGNQNIRPA